jgi:hypothetical protein
MIGYTHLTLYRRYGRTCLDTDAVSFANAAIRVLYALRVLIRPGLQCRLLSRLRQTVLAQSRQGYFHRWRCDDLSGAFISGAAARGSEASNVSGTRTLY